MTSLNPEASATPGGGGEALEAAWLRGALGIYVEGLEKMALVLERQK